MTDKQSTKTQSKYSLSQWLLRITIAISISLLVYFVIAKFYYAHFAEKQQHINSYLKAQINEVDLKLKEVRNLNRIRSEYFDLLSVQSHFRESKERNAYFLPELFESLPFEWSLKQMDISSKQTHLTFEVLNSANVELGINRLNRRLDQYQITKTSEHIEINQNYKEIEIKIKKLDKSQVNQ